MSFFDPPEVSIVEHFHAHGSLRAGGTVVQDAYISVTWRPYVVDRPLRLRASVGATRGHHAMHLSTNSVVVHFEGEDSVGGTLSGQVIHPGSSSDGELIGDLERVDVGVTKLEEMPGNQGVEVRLTPTSLATARESGWAGLEAGLESENAAQEFETSLGRWRLLLSGRVENVSVDGMRAHVEVYSPTLRLIRPASAPRRDISSVMADVLVELEPFLDTLSFLSRRLVGVVEIRVRSEGEAQGRNWNHLGKRLFHPRSSPPSYDPFLVPARLPPDALAQATEALVGSSFAAGLRQAVFFILGYWQRERIESANATAFRALEALANGMAVAADRHRSLPRGKARELRVALKRAIHRTGADLGISPSDLAEVEGRLSDIGRRGIVSLICEAIDSAGVPWSDLFPPGSELRKEMAAAYRRRSVLTHRGVTDDIGALVDDATRTNALAERILGTLLGLDASWVHPIAYDYARWTPHHIVG